MLFNIAPRTQDIGFPVKRLLPSKLKQRVGPFIFVDHMGPALFKGGTTEGDVRQHPHIGLATVTYLFSGAMMHKDSLGFQQRIEPGAINLMTAGSGIVHSERMPEDVRQQTVSVEGVQIWLALPTENETGEPSFVHYPAAAIPELHLSLMKVRVLIGSALGAQSPVQTLSPTTYLDLQMEAGAVYIPEFPGHELAIYIAAGNLSINGEPIPEFHLCVLEPGDKIEALSAARALLLGGEPLSGERFILWNFVASSREQVRAASQRWEEGDFALVEGETEFIPLPKM